MMELNFIRFLIHTGMSEDDPRAIPEFEIMARIARLLPSTTTDRALIRFWKRAFAEHSDEERASVYRVRRGCGAVDAAGKGLHFTPYDFIAFSNMDRSDESWYREFTIMRRIAAMVPACTPPSAVRRLWRESYRAAPLSGRKGVCIRRPVPDIYGTGIQTTTSSL